LPSSIGVTVITKNRASLGEDATPANVETIETSQPEAEVLQQSKKGFDLMILASDRGFNSVLESDFVKHTDIPLMVIYPERDEKVTKHFDHFKNRTPTDSIEVV